MITQNNFKDIIQSIDSDEIEKAMCHEYILVEVNIFNAGFIVNITGHDHYNDEVMKEAFGNGNLFVDTMTFENLINELN